MSRFAKYGAPPPAAESGKKSPAVKAGPLVTPTRLPPGSALPSCPSENPVLADDDFFLEGGAMKFIKKSAIITGEYWVRVY
jgi:hypothetical protein